MYIITRCAKKYDVFFYVCRYIVLVMSRSPCMPLVQSPHFAASRPCPTRPDHCCCRSSAAHGSRRALPRTEPSKAAPPESAGAHRSGADSRRKLLVSGQRGIINDAELNKGFSSHLHKTPQPSPFQPSPFPLHSGNQSAERTLGSDRTLTCPSPWTHRSLRARRRQPRSPPRCFPARWRRGAPPCLRQSPRRWCACRGGCGSAWVWSHSPSCLLCPCSSCSGHAASTACRAMQQ